MSGHEARMLAGCGVFVYWRRLLIPVLLCGLLSVSCTAYGADFTGWSHSTKIEFTGYNKPETLTDFPVLVNLGTNTIEGFLYTDVASSEGWDIRFESDAGNEMPYEIERWDTNGTSFVWVRVPAITPTNSGSVSFIRMHYGNPGQTAQQTYTTNGSVWVNGFAGVWHLSSNAGNRFKDSSPGQWHGIVNGPNPANIQGVAGPGADFDETTNIIVNSTFGLGASNLTMSCWVKLDSASESGAFIKTGMDGSGIGIGAGSATFGDNGNSLVGVYDSATWIGTARPIGVGSWRQTAVSVDVVRDSRFYVDGVEQFLQSTRNQSIPAGNVTFFGGCWTMGTNAYVDAWMDEIRISTVARSANWVWAEWCNIASNKLFASYGAPESVMPVVNNGAGASDVTTDAARLWGTLTSTGGAPTTVRIYWGATDGGASGPGWANTNDFGVIGAGPFSANVSGLASNTLYFYRSWASNSAGASWAPQSIVFQTGPDFPPPGMARIPAGSFLMGGILAEGPTDEYPRHAVYISTFHMDQNEVSHGKWIAVRDWALTNGYVFDNPGAAMNASHPVHTVSWYDCVKWCNARSEKDGLVPVYTTNGAPYRAGQEVPDVNWSGSGYRLPTEAEWEKAARGGSVGRRFPWSDTDDVSHSRANYFAGGGEPFDLSWPAGYHPAWSNTLTCPVDAFDVNGYGLRNMAGNVREWCWDRFTNDYYSVSPPEDPRGPATGGGAHVCRGGAFNMYAGSLRCAARSNAGATDAGNTVGFRCVRTGAADIDLGLIAYYTLDGNANDVSGNGNDGVVSGAVITSNRFGAASSAYWFDGVDDEITVADAGSLNPTGMISVCAWVKCADVGEPSRVIQKGASDNQYALRFDAGRTVAEVTGATPGRLLAPSPSANLWHHVAFTYDGFCIRIYHDGRIAGQVAASGALSASGDALSIGNKPGSNGDTTHLVGAIDDVRIYSRALSSGEVKQLYRLGDVDWDADGLPDWWEAQYGVGDPSMIDTDYDGIFDRDEDPDGDGWENMVEYENGTDPTAPDPAPGSPVVNNDTGATDVTADSARLWGNLVSTGNFSTAVHVFWGTADGGTNESAWANTNDLGVLDSGLFTVNVTGLAPGNMYHYRCWASNQAGVVWAPGTTDFATLPRFYSVVYESTNHNIWVCSADGVAHEQLTFTGDCYDPRWSHNGKRILFRRNGADVWVMNGDGSGKLSVGYWGGGNLGGLTWVGPDDFLVSHDTMTVDMFVLLKGRTSGETMQEIYRPATNGMPKWGFSDDYSPRLRRLAHVAADSNSTPQGDVYLLDPFTWQMTPYYVDGGNDREDGPVRWARQSDRVAWTHAVQAGAAPANREIGIGDLTNGPVQWVAGELTQPILMSWTDKDDLLVRVYTNGADKLAVVDDQGAVRWWIECPDGIVNADWRQPLGAPEAVAASYGWWSNRVVVKWGAVEGADGYEVYRSTTNQLGSATLVAGVAANQFIDFATPQGAVSWYWVRATNANGRSDYSRPDEGYRTSGPGLLDGMLAYYPFDGNAADETGNGHDGTTFGLATAQDRFGVMSRAYEFNNPTSPNPATAYVTIPDSPTLRPTASLTLSAWCFTANPSPGVLLAKELGTGSQDSFAVWQPPPSTAIWVVVRNDLSADCYLPAPAPAAWAWHLVTATYDGTSVRFYTDGRLSGSAAFTGPLDYDSHPLIIGAGENNNDSIHEDGWNGRIDDVRIYGRALTSNEVKRLYQLEDVDGDMDGLPDWWEMQYFGGLGQTGSGDADGDGQVNVQEYENGSDPAHGLPAVDNASGATEVTASTAKLAGRLLSDGGLSTELRVYWGTSDGGTDEALWSRTNVLGVCEPGAFHVPVGGLSTGTVYFYRYRAGNMAGVAWAPETTNFTTLSSAVFPHVDNYNGAGNITPFSATLTAALNGGAPANCYIYWGTSDGGTVKTAWSNGVPFGPRGMGPYATNVTGLTPSTMYYYRAYATNGFGEEWALATTNFWTAPETNSLDVFSPHGSPVPVAGRTWWVKGTVVSAGVDGSPVPAGPTTQFVCRGWIRTGSEAGGGTGTNTSFTISDATTLTWRWTTNFWLQASGQTATGAVNVASGWQETGSNVVITATPSNGYSFWAWSGTTNGCTISGSQITVPMTAARTIAASFKLNLYDITAAAGPNGTISPSGTVWVPHGGSTNFLINPSANHSITGLVVDGVPVPNTNKYTFSNLTNGGHTIVAQFGTNVFTLSVLSAHGTPSPSGTTTNCWNTHLSASIGGAQSVNGSTQYVCTGWTGSGSVPATGSGTNVSFVILTNSTLTWQWKTNFWLSVAPAGGGTVSRPSGWLPAGSNVTVTGVASSGYHFAGWSGDTNGCVLSGPQIVVPMTRPRDITAGFAVDIGSLRVFISPVLAVNAGAMWQLIGDEVWRTNGAVVSGLQGGISHSVTFKTLEGWTAPLDMGPIGIADGGTTTLSAVYVQGEAVLVRGGTFQMGVDTTGNGGHSVTLDDFWLDRRTVTAGEYRQFCTNTGRAFPAQPWTDDALPVVNVTWQDASDFAAHVGKRLPSEAEYEYAMRGGQPYTVRYAFGNSINSELANYNFMAGRTTVSGTYPPTGERIGIELEDISGNVWSWCRDWHTNVLTGPVANPMGPATGKFRVIRGGSWASSEVALRCHTRYEAEPGMRHSDLGFRCAKSATTGATPPADTDSDGLPDWWENWFFSSVDLCNPSGDPDSDGMHNWQEYVAGTDPTVAGSVLRIRVLSVPPDFRLQWPSVQGKLYTVERSTNAVLYAPIAVDLPATPPVNTYTDSPVGPGSFLYRVMVQP